MSVNALMLIILWCGWPAYNVKFDVNECRKRLMSCVDIDSIMPSYNLSKQNLECFKKELK